MVGDSAARRARRPARVEGKSGVVVGDSIVDEKGLDFLADERVRASEVKRDCIISPPSL